MSKLVLANILCCMVALLLLAENVSAGVYDRVVGISYANKGGYQYDYPDSRIFAAFDLVKPKNVTSVIPFLLNCDATKYDSAMQELKKRNIVMIPAIGDNDHANIDDPYFKTIAQSYFRYTKYIRLELLEQFISTPAGFQRVQNMIDYLIQTGFQHIMLNPWPPGSNGNAYPFTGAALESTIFAVSLPDFERTPPYTVHPDPINWYPPAAGRVNRVRNYKPSVAVLANYENAPQHLALAGLSRTAQINAMTTTIDQIHSNGLRENWCAPWSANYDPLVEGTWDWIASALKQL